jgi:hypothetical protein
MTGYYDYVLGLIPAALIGVTAVLNLVGLSLTAALPGGALAAGAIMAHAIFVKAPVTDETRVRADRAVGGSTGRSNAPRRSRSTGRSRTGGAD